MISVGDLKRSMAFELDGQLMSVIEWQHIKMGRGGAIVKVKMRNLRSGSIMERSFDAGEKFPRVDLDEHTVTFQYQDGDLYYFMDTETFDQIPLTSAQLGDNKYYLLDGLNFELVSYGDEPLSIEPPITVDLRVTYTEPGFKGDTATGGTKPATLETGLTVQVPLFISTGDVIRVKTDAGTYLERV
ncbi:MAG TPA: elongation factor P [Ktedonobacterales bacterium]|nr:elongation factor P [Ktedonobacterales bacterium]